MITKFLIKYIFKIENEIVVSLGSKLQDTSIFAPVKPINIWKQEPFNIKLKSILNLKWTPSEDLIQKEAIKILKTDIFGNEDDYADQLLMQAKIHNSYNWDFSFLTSEDKTKAKALYVLQLSAFTKYEKTDDELHLKLYKKSPFICLLLHPMYMKIPVISIQYYISIHVHYAFNSIRKAQHPQSDQLVDYLYETLYLQFKTAIAINEFYRQYIYSLKNKESFSSFMHEEVNAILYADLIFSYLKATVEKVLVLVGLTYGITNLDSKPKHKAKISTLKEKLPKEIFDIYYVKFMFKHFSSENLDELNNYRSGILHKKGIADLQPHNYVDKKANEVPLNRIFSVLHEQHVKNSAVLIGALAILTDRLLELDFPDFKIEDFEL